MPVWAVAQYFTRVCLVSSTLIVSVPKIPSTLHSLFSNEDFDAENGSDLVDHAENEMPLQHKCNAKCNAQKECQVCISLEITSY